MEQARDSNGVPPEESNDTLLSRRHLLKALAATGGAAAASSLLPSKWVKPVVDVGLLPAHAQVSPPLGTGDLQATLTWDTGNPNAQSCSMDNGTSGGVDIDVHVIEPNGDHVYFANRTGSTAQLDVDNQVALGPENIFVPPGGAAAGVYQVYVVYYCGQVPTQATIRIRVFADTAQEQSQTFVRTLNAADFAVGYNVANVTFPGGTIQETTGTRPSAVLLSATKN